MFFSLPRSSGSPPAGGFGEARLPLSTLSEFPEPPLSSVLRQTVFWKLLQAEYRCAKLTGTCVLTPNGIMGTSKPLIQLLDNESLSILRDIFRLAQEGDASVDASNYRAQHEDSLEAFNRLESYGLLRKENDRYRVSLVGLPLLGDQEADSLLATFEQLFVALRHFYKSNQRDQLSLVDLAGVVKVSLHEVRKCLSYMVEGSWWGGRSNDFYASAEALSCSRFS